MRIERHQVGEDELIVALDSFVERIDDDVYRMQNDESPAWGWEMVAESFLDYLGALSVTNPDLTGKDARIACESAAAAAVGSLALRVGRAGHPHVFIEYTGTGVSYRDDRPAEDPHGVSAGDWLDSFFLAFVAKLSDQHGTLFVAAAPELRGNEHRADVALVHALLAYVYGHAAEAGVEARSDQERVAVIDSITERLGDGTGWPGCRAALTTLRAVAAGDQEAYNRALARQLEQYRQPYADSANSHPRTLLPFEAIALAAMAVRWNEWSVGVDSPYLPAAAVAGFKPPAPRVLSYGRHKRPDAVEELAAGPLVIERPEHPYADQPGRSVYERHAVRELEEFRDLEQELLQVTRGLTDLMRRQVSAFLERAASDPDGQDARQRTALRIAAEAGTAAFRLARAEAGTEHEVTVDGTTRLLPAWRSSHSAGTGHWKQAVAAALIAGEPQQAAELVAPEFFVKGGRVGPVDAYGAALHDYLRGVDPVAAVDRALTVCAQYEQGRYLAPPVRLLSQLVEGDQVGFALALADALENHREHFTLADLSGDAEALVDLDILALACHAHRLGWDVPVSSPYLPMGLLPRSG